MTHTHTLNIFFPSPLLYYVIGQTHSNTHISTRTKQTLLAKTSGTERMSNLVKKSMKQVRHYILHNS